MMPEGPPATGGPSARKSGALPIELQPLRAAGTRTRISRFCGTSGCEPAGPYPAPSLYCTTPGDVGDSPSRQHRTARRSGYGTRSNRAGAALVRASTIRLAGPFIRSPNCTSSTRATMLHITERARAPTRRRPETRPPHHPTARGAAVARCSASLPARGEVPHHPADARVTATARTCSACALESRRSPQYGRPERDITRLPEKIGPPVWRSSSARWSKIPTGWAARCAASSQACAQLAATATGSPSTSMTSGAVSISFILTTEATCTADRTELRNGRFGVALLPWSGQASGCRTGSCPAAWSSSRGAVSASVHTSRILARRENARRARSAEGKVPRRP